MTIVHGLITNSNSTIGVGWDGRSVIPPVSNAGVSYVDYDKNPQTANGSTQATSSLATASRFAHVITGWRTTIQEPRHVW